SPLLTLGLAAVTLYSAWRMLEEHGAPLRSAAGVTVLVALGVTAALTLRTPGVIAAAGVLALAFHRRAVLLLGLGVVFLIAFGALYYCGLSRSLLAKSGALVGSGLALLALRQFVVW